MKIELILCAVFLLAAFYTDALRSIIPNRLTVPAVLAGLTFHGWSGGWDGLLFALAGMAGGIAVMLVLYALGAVGAGDVKLFGALGALIGLQLTLYSIMYSILYAGLIGVVIVLVRREFSRMRRMPLAVFQLPFMRKWQPLRMERMKQLRFPFMYAVLPGACTAYFYLH